MKNKVFCIIIASFYAVFSILLFFPFFVFKHVYHPAEGKTATDKTYYSILDIKDSVNGSIFLVFAILVLIASLFVIFTAIYQIIKKDYFNLLIKISTSIVVVLFAVFALMYTMVFTIALFLMICLNMFVIAFDVKQNKRKKGNIICFILTYVPFVFMLIVSAGLTATK